MSLQIGKAIYEMLHSDTAIMAKLQDKIFPLISEHNTTFPFIVYKRTGIVPAYTKDKYAVNESVTMDFIIASDKYNETIEIADLVRLSLEGKRGLYSDIKIEDIRLLSADEDFIEDTYIQTITFNIITNGKYNS